MDKLVGFVVGMNSLTKELADVFADDTENDVTFYGFSDTELKDTISDFEHEAQPEISPEEQEATSQPPAIPQPFRMRIALRFPSFAHRSSDCEDAEEEEKRSITRGVKRPRKRRRTKTARHVKFEAEETAVTGPSPSEELGSDSEYVADTFLVKRQENIKANKAMLAQLMADLQKMQGGAAILKNQAANPKTKGRISRPPHSAATGGESRRNPERASRRQTRSMGGSKDPSTPQADVELSLEEELLEVRRSPKRRGNPRPNQSKPHIIRPVDDITEDELQLVVDNMTDKVYNSVTGSTCHQCRQKTVDTKTCCRSEDCRGIQGQFCGPCLRNRYGEDVRKALLDPFLSRLYQVVSQKMNNPSTLLNADGSGNVLHVEVFVTAASAASVRAAAQLASCSRWLSIMVSLTSTHTSAGGPP
ncbi:cell division cycle-associated protein 7-like isoform 2-T2 [Odontesthes bonariensis]|uniref:cell division cycle-associated protein 7-like isoform X2 n=1 Tax=Odontesthes bonariensis TaxID=219752 RepID=UPI003F58F935